MNTNTLWMVSSRHRPYNNIQICPYYLINELILNKIIIKNKLLRAYSVSLVTVSKCILNYVMLVQLLKYIDLYQKIIMSFKKKPDEKCS